MKNLWNREPVAIVATVQALLALVMTFGVKLTLEQTGAILAAVSAVLGLVTRSQVTPVAKPPDDKGSVDVTTVLVVIVLALLIVFLVKKI